MVHKTQKSDDGYAISNRRGIHKTDPVEKEMRELEKGMKEYESAIDEKNEQFDETEKEFQKMEEGFESEERALAGSVGETDEEERDEGWGVPTAQEAISETDEQREARQKKDQEEWARTVESLKATAEVVKEGVQKAKQFVGKVVETAKELPEELRYKAEQKQKEKEALMEKQAQVKKVQVGKVKGKPYKLSEQVEVVGV